MSQTVYMELGREAMGLALLLATPIFFVALVVGLMVSIFQAVTSINDQTLTFVPKIVAIAMVLIVFGPWMSVQLVTWSGTLFGDLGKYIR
ncbi:MAG: flagellar biosynthesis protein FliQ [bacterium]